MITWGDRTDLTAAQMNNPELDPPMIQSDWGSAMFSVYEEDSNSSCGSLGASALSLKTPQGEDNDPDAEEKLCAVCSDKANGYHFHVLTCEGCKGFFRRSMTKGLTFTCPFTRSCPVNKAKRRRCQACRLQKCLEVGMRKDMILSDEALMARRDLRMRKKQERLQRMQKAPEVGSLTEEQKQQISILIEAHRKHFDNFEHFVDYRPQPILRVNWENMRQHGPSSCPPASVDQCLTSPHYSDLVTGGDTLKELPHFADMSTYMIQQVIKFAKEIPVFRALSIDDQISLLKGSTMEVSHLQFNTVFNLETKMWECGRHKLSIEHAVLTGFQRMYLEPLLKFHISLRNLKLHESEYVLMEALALFSPDRPGVIEHTHIDRIQEMMAMTLKCYIDYHHPLPGSRFLFAKLLSMLAELRTLNEENAKQMVHIQNVMEDAMTPLMKEIFS
ncbi:nuclear receptor subfamily 1 group I member 3 isoform X1 [Bufo bufo]|uniref:nuclear receptor subfamily 1 group I member 3 isoform X1 n=2 Tax=Bufo bufo TaxID=8384 RepID=UPI001ABE491E|nr:nuclear receptor subfamily 1 group I member 3 isoform X1 [Bufo bufo]